MTTSSSTKASSLIRKTRNRQPRVSIPLSGIRRMHKSGDISDAAMAAAELFHVLCQVAKSDGLKSVDYSRERVDCRAYDSLGIVDRRLRAKIELERFSLALSARAYHVLMIVVGSEGSVADLGRSLKLRKTDASKALKEALGDLGLVGVAKGAGYGIWAHF